MPVFFAFSDESGKYKKERSEKFITKNPYYCRATVIVEADEWTRLQEDFALLKKDLLHMDSGQDIKWSYIWSLYKHFQKGEKIPSNKPYFPLRGHSLDTLVEFIRQTLQLLSACENSRLLFTVTFNQRKRTNPVETEEIIQQHLKYALDKAENEMRKIKRSLCIFFFSPEEPRVEKYLKKAFLRIAGKNFSRQYPHLKDSLNFELSSQSFGGQLADYCAGVFNGCLRLFPQSIDLFRHELWPKIIKDKNQVLGQGIKEIPANAKNRTYLQNVLEEIFATEMKDYRVSLEERLHGKK